MSNMKQLNNTTIGNDHIIRPAASFKQVTGSYFERRTPKKDAPRICPNRTT